MTASYVSSGQKIAHTPDHPCRLCGGHTNLPAGKGVRCNGYEQGDMVWCERIESPRVNVIGTYGHYMRGSCRCGQTHGFDIRPPVAKPAQNITKTITKNPRPPDDKPLAGAIRTIDYELRTEAGDHVATHRRYEFADKPKTFRWFLPNGRMGLGGLSSRDVPMYGSERLKGIPRDGSVSVLVVEGEKAADWLRARGYAVLSSATGAPNIPGAEALSILKGLQVIQWPDNDGVGTQQADAYLRALDGVAGGVYRIDVSSMPEHGDAADWAGTADELSAFIYGATKVAAPLPADAAEGAVAAASEFVDADRRRRKLIRDRSSRALVTTQDEDNVQRGTDMAACMERWLPAICGGCGARPAFLMTCHDALCPLCAPGRFKHDWQVMIDLHPDLKSDRFNLVRYLPDAPVSGPKALRELRQQFTSARKRAHLQAGTIGNRTSRQHGGVMLLSLPMAVGVPLTLGGFTAEIVREDVSERDAATWMWQEYEDEIVEAVEAAEAGDAEYFSDWLEATRGRKRFSSFGKLWRTTYSPSEDDRTVTSTEGDAVAVSIAAFGGGSGNAGGREKRKCPFCGSTRLTKYSFKLTADRLTHERGHAEWVPIAP